MAGDVGSKSLAASNLDTWADDVSFKQVVHPAPERGSLAFANRTLHRPRQVCEGLSADVGLEKWQNNLATAFRPWSLRS